MAGRLAPPSKAAARPTSPARGKSPLASPTGKRQPDAPADANAETRNKKELMAAKKNMKKKVAEAKSCAKKLDATTKKLNTALKKYQKMEESAKLKRAQMNQKIEETLQKSEKKCIEIHSELGEVTAQSSRAHATLCYLEQAEEMLAQGMFRDPHEEEGGPALEENISGGFTRLPTIKFSDAPPIEDSPPASGRPSSDEGSSEGGEDIFESAPARASVSRARQSIKDLEHALSIGLEPSDEEAEDVTRKFSVKADQVTRRMSRKLEDSSKEFPPAAVMHDLEVMREEMSTELLRRQWAERKLQNIEASEVIVMQELKEAENRDRRNEMTMQNTTAQVRQLEAAIVSLEQEDPRDARQRGIDRGALHGADSAATERVLREELWEAQTREGTSELSLQKTSAKLRHFEALAEECERLHRGGRARGLDELSNSIGAIDSRSNQRMPSNLQEERRHGANGWGSPNERHTTLNPTSVSAHGDSGSPNARRGFIASVCAELQQHGFESEAVELKNNLQQRYRRLAELNAKLGRPYISDEPGVASTAPGDMRSLVQEASTESRRLRSELAELEAQVRRHGGEISGQDELKRSLVAATHNSTSSPRRYVDGRVIDDALDLIKSNGLLHVGPGQIKMSPPPNEVSTSVNMSGSPSIWTPSTYGSPLSAAAHTVVHLT